MSFLRMIVAGFFVCLSAIALAEENPILQRVPELQKLAARTNGGEMGCGEGSMTLVTSKGEVKVTCGLDPMHVFGHTIKTADLVALLKSRCESNRSGAKGPMSEGVGDLCYVILETLSYSQDPEVVPVVAEMLQDKVHLNATCAAIALIRLGNSNAELQKKVAEIEFPKDVLAGAHGAGEKRPGWLTKVK